MYSELEYYNNSGLDAILEESKRLGGDAVEFIPNGRQIEILHDKLDAQYIPAFKEYTEVLENSTVGTLGSPSMFLWSEGDGTTQRLLFEW